MRSASGSSEVSRYVPANSTLRSLLWPDSVAVIGASASAKKIGGRVVDYLRRGGFTGTIIPVNPGRVDEPGVLASIADLAEPSDVAVVAVPRGTVHSVLEGAEDKVKNVVVLTAGYEETGRQLPQPAQEDLLCLKRLAEKGVGVLGPNCNGYFNIRHSAIISFAPVFETIMGSPAGSGVILITQSGAFGARVASASLRRGVPLDGYINTGNERGYTLGSVLSGIATVMPGIHTVALYVESFRDGESLAAASRQATESGLKVMVLHGGQSQRGQEGARSHTAAITPPAKLVRDLLEYAGAFVVDSDAELMDAITLTSTVGVLPADPRLAVLTISGGVGVLAADRCERHRIQLPRLSDATQQAIAPLVPEFASLGNPVDMTGHASTDPDYQMKVAHALASAHEVDIIVSCVPQAMIPGVVAGIGDDAVPVQIVLDGTTEELQALALEGIPAFPSVSGAIDAVAASRRTYPGVILESSPAARISESNVRSLAEALDIVRTCGVSLPGMRVAASAAEAGDAGEALGWPVTLKANCDPSIHKKFQGLVHLAITNRGELEDLAGQLLADWSDVVVQKHLAVDRELLVGARLLPEFGGVIVVGLGGSLAEALRLSVAVPCDASGADLPLGLTDFRRLHEAFPEIDRWWSSLLQIGQNLWSLCEGGCYQEIEINPVAVVGGDLVALDARFVGETTR